MNLVILFTQALDQLNKLNQLLKGIKYHLKPFCNHLVGPCGPNKILQIFGTSTMGLLVEPDAPSISV